MDSNGKGRPRHRREGSDVYTLAVDGAWSRPDREAVNISRVGGRIIGGDVERRAIGQNGESGGRYDVFGRRAGERERHIVQAVARADRQSRHHLHRCRAGSGSEWKDANRTGAGVGSGTYRKRLISIEHEKVGLIRSHRQRIDSRRVLRVEGIELSVAAYDELDDAVVILVGNEEVLVVGRDGFSNGVAPGRWKRRGGNLAHAAGLGVDLKDIDL